MILPLLLLLLSLVLLLLLFCNDDNTVNAQTIANVYANEQYATVMRAEDYVFNNGTIGALPSLFIGLFHMALVPGPGSMYTMTTLVWHQVDFATQIEMRVAPVGVANTEPIPAYILATGSGATASNSPIFGSFLVDAVFVANLRASLVYVQVLASQVSGFLRGQLQSRHDVLVAFPSLTPFTGTQYTATAGMALLYAQPSPNQRGYVTLEYWILSRYVAPAIWNANDGYVNFSTAVIFGSIPVTQTTGVTLTITPNGVPLIIAPLNLVFTSRMENNVGGTGPITGPGSSRLVLVKQTSFLEETYSEFIRLAYYDDFAFVNTTGAGIGIRPTMSGLLVFVVSIILLLL